MSFMTLEIDKEDRYSTACCRQLLLVVDLELWRRALERCRRVVERRLVRLCIGGSWVRGNEAGPAGEISSSEE